MAHRGCAPWWSTGYSSCLPPTGTHQPGPGFGGTTVSASEACSSSSSSSERCRRSCVAPVSTSAKSRVSGVDLEILIGSFLAKVFYNLTRLAGAGACLPPTLFLLISYGGREQLPD